MLNRQGRPTTPAANENAHHTTFTGNRALLQLEPLLFEIGRADTTASTCRSRSRCRTASAG